MLRNPWNTGTGALGTDIFGFNVDLSSILPSALDAAKTTAITSVVQSSDVQQALKTSGQQAAVQTIAQKIAAITPTQIVMYGTAILGLSYFIMKKMR